MNEKCTRDPTKEARLAYRAEWRRNNKEKVRQSNSKYYRKQKEKKILEQASEIIAQRQNELSVAEKGMCWVCKKSVANSVITCKNGNPAAPFCPNEIPICEKCLEAASIRIQQGGNE